MVSGLADQVWAVKGRDTGTLVVGVLKTFTCLLGPQSEGGQRVHDKINLFTTQKKNREDKD